MRARKFYWALAALALIPVRAIPQTKPADLPKAMQTPYPGQRWQPGPARFGQQTVTGVKVRMSDGVLLDASIAYPVDLATGQRAVGRFPVVIEHTPYTADGVPPSRSGPVNAYYTTYGYISVRVHSRGTGASTGVHGFWSPREAEDGAALVRWAAHDIEGTDGRVAFVGCSFAGGYALGAAAAAGPNSPLKAVVAACIALDSTNRNDILVSGVPTQDLAFFYNAPAGAMSANSASLDFYKNFGAEILRGGDMAYARDFWNERLPLSYTQQIVDNGVPVLQWIGWKDYVGIGALRTYSAFQNAYAGRPIDAPMVAGQPTSPRYQIVVGDWTHAQGLDNGVILQWLETWLKSVDTGIGKTKSPLHLYEPQTDRWVNTDRFPMTDRYTAWHLAADGTLGTTPPKAAGSGRLVRGEPAAPGGTLAFTSPALAKGATIAGPMAATIYASSSNRNLELVAEVEDVAPDGTVKKVTKGAMIGSMRALDPRKTWKDAAGKTILPWQTLTGDAYLKPASTYRFDLQLEPRQWGVLPGHRIRLLLTTKPHASECPGPQKRASGNSPCYLTDVQKSTIPGGTYRIMYGPRFPSHLTLPQLAPRAFAETACRVTPTSGDVCLPANWGQ
ncbi:CocE/NonD family hydrolase [Sphingobium sp. H39-3-25]|uniref:CocE/NonD family hydrolase n=1 Tax=Sphingobium arseniciresistens TaxID=3030834 RepID=UPI0023B8B8A5|nr:CocE/NonD family hydrolase [Sphingobium arseniciresistens]